MARARSHGKPVRCFTLPEWEVEMRGPDEADQHGFWYAEHVDPKDLVPER